MRQRLRDGKRSRTRCSRAMKCNVVARPVSRMLRATASSQIGPMSYQTGQGRSGATVRRHRGVIAGDRAQWPRCGWHGGARQQPPRVGRSMAQAGDRHSWRPAAVARPEPATWPSSARQTWPMVRCRCWPHAGRHGFQGSAAGPGRSAARRGGTKLGASEMSGKRSFDGRVRVVREPGLQMASRTR